MLVMPFGSDLGWQRVLVFGLQLRIQIGKATALADLELYSSLPVSSDWKVIRVGKVTQKSAYSPGEVSLLRMDSPCMLVEEVLLRAAVTLY
jgi:hypothetical protein